MTGEQFLNSIRGLDLEITALDHERCRVMDRRQDLLDKAECIGANLSGVCVQTSVGSKTESIGVQLADMMTVEQVAKKLNDYQERINRKIDELIDKKQRAQDIIDKLLDARHRALLKHRYVSDLKWATIADIMSYTEAYTRVDLKDQAILAFEIVWKNIHQKPSFI